jgi:hypothetical protein
VQTLARQYARNEPEAEEKVNEVLAGISLDIDVVLDGARARKSNELVREYVAGEPDAITLVHEFLTTAGTSMDVFMANALAEKLDEIERIDRLTAIAEDRRNDSLHEIERHRAVFGRSTATKRARDRGRRV